MNYKKIYDSIISNAINRSIDVYTEKHHIVPRSFGGSNSKNNIVRLTAREHFMCHYLLCKIYEKNTTEWHSAIKAFNMMCSRSTTHRRYVNSRLYQSIRQHMSATMSDLQRGSKNSQHGTCWINKSGTVKKIPKDEFVLYETQGWTRGRIPPKPKRVIHQRVLKRPQSAGLKNSQAGSYWINNGTDNKKIKGPNIPEGWVKGRLMTMMN